MIFEYAVFDERYHSIGTEAGALFATNDLSEAKTVANEVGFRSVVVRLTPAPELTYDARFNADLPLAP